MLYLYRCRKYSVNRYLNRIFYCVPASGRFSHVCLSSTPSAIGYPPASHHEQELVYAIQRRRLHRDSQMLLQASRLQRSRPAVGLRAIRASVPRLFRAGRLKHMP
jgi:hypothetical protein